MTIEQMEAKARNEADGSWSKKIRGVWLEVLYRHGAKGNDNGNFQYQWGKNYVSREVAENVLKTA